MYISYEHRLRVKNINLVFACCIGKVICVPSIPEQVIHQINHIKRRVNRPLKIDPQSTWSTYPIC